MTMTLTPSTLRLDIKCGKGSISQGEKCHKGTATKASLTENALKLGGAVGVVGSLAYGMRPKANPFGAISAMNASVAAIAAGTAMEGKRTRNKVKQKLGTAIAGAQLGAAAFNAYAANLTTNFNRTYNQAANTVNEGRREANQAYSNAYNNARSKQEGYQRGSSSYGESGRTRANNAVTNPFRDLGVSEKASDDVVKNAWKRLMRQNHPDVGGDPEKAKRINAAYQEILRRRGRKDSIYADGFDIDWSAIQL